MAGHQAVDVGNAEGEDVLTMRTREAQGDVRAAVTAVLPLVMDGDGSHEDIRHALQVLGIGTCSERDLAVLAGAVHTAQAFALLGESLDVDPQVVWQTYLAQAS